MLEQVWYDYLSLDCTRRGSPAKNKHRISKLYSRSYWFSCHLVTEMLTSYCFFFFSVADKIWNESKHFIRRMQWNTFSKKNYWLKIQIILNKVGIDLINQRVRVFIVGRIMAWVMISFWCYLRFLFLCTINMTITDIYVPLFQPSLDCVSLDITH